MPPIRIRNGVITAILGVLTSPAHAQQPGLVPLRVPGIEGATISGIEQDRLGALWLATNRGLLRFDGAGLERYVSNPADPRAILSDGLYHVDLGADGAIWASTISGAYRIDPVTGERGAVRFERGDGPAQALECLSTAPGARGQWAFAGGMGVYFCAHGDTVFRYVTRDPDRSYRAAAGWEAPDGTLWYCDRSTIRHLDPATGRETTHPCRVQLNGQTLPVLFTGMQADRYDTDVLWCNTWGTGFIRFHRTTGSFTAHLSRLPPSGLWNIVRSAVQLDRERWLLSVDDSLKVFDGRTIRDPATPTNAHGLCRSRGGEVIIGHGGTLQLLAVDHPQTRWLDGVLNGPSMNVIPSATDSGLWAVRFYKDRALMHTDGGGRILATLPFPVEERQCEPFRLLATARPGPAGTIWVGSTRGLWRHAPGTDRLELIPLKVPGIASERPRVMDLVEDVDGRIWLNLSGTVARFDPATRSCTPVAWPASLQQPTIAALARLDAGVCIAVPTQGRPWIIDGRSMKAAPMDLADMAAGELDGLLGAVVTPGREVVLLASAGRLLHLRPPRHAGDRWHRVHQWQLPRRPVFQEAACDGRGRIWLTSDVGAYLLDLPGGVVHALDAAHGVARPCFGSAATLPDGGIVLSGLGTALFGPRFEPRADPINLVIRRLTVNGADSTAAAVRNRILRLPHDRNNINVSFGCIALLEGDVLEYAYRMVHDGDTSAWSSLDQQRSFNLTGLPPGEHLVMIGAGGQGAQAAQAYVRLLIGPPWWATWWARSAMLAASVVLVVLATRQVLMARYRRRLREVEREREVERVRMRIARDIHDGIGSGLTKITMMTRQLPGDAEQAGRIARASTDLVNELGEIVWTVDPRNDSFGSFIAFVRSTLGRQFEDLSMDLRTDLRCEPEDRERIIGPELKRNVLLVMKEAVNNALKHSGGSRIEVRLELARTELLLQVMDNGRGFAPGSTRDGGNGLINFRKRAEAIGGAVDVRTGPTGTTVELRAPVASTFM